VIKKDRSGLTVCGAQQQLFNPENPPGAAARKIRNISNLKNPQIVLGGNICKLFLHFPIKMCFTANYISFQASAEKLFS